jgi:pimeloyl-ACP methyl ester carboxylesterase
MGKVIMVLVIAILVIVIVLIIALAIVHTRRLRQEVEIYTPVGSMVNVNGSQMHVFSAGDAEQTALVFLSGHGTSSPTMDFKPLWNKLQGEYRVSVVERPGYGWSTHSGKPRDIETMLEETREALRLAGETPPYVLLPHSMAGLEALYWASKHPQEVRAIIGLDPCTPDSIDLLPPFRTVQLNFMYLISRLGLPRYIPDADIDTYLPLMQYEGFLEHDRASYRSLLYRSSFTRDMLNELRYLTQNAATVAEQAIPHDTPMLFFLSKEQEHVASGWERVMTSYLLQIENSELVPLETSHYLHHDKADQIVERIRLFIDNTRSVHTDPEKPRP